MVDTLDPDDFNPEDLDPEGKGDWYKFRAGDFKNNPDMLMDAMMNNKFQEIVARLDPNDKETLDKFKEIIEPINQETGEEVVEKLFKFEGFDFGKGEMWGTWFTDENGNKYIRYYINDESSPDGTLKRNANGNPINNWVSENDPRVIAEREAQWKAGEFDEIHPDYKELKGIEESTQKAIDESPDGNWADDKVEKPRVPIDNTPEPVDPKVIEDYDQWENKVQNFNQAIDDYEQTNNISTNEQRIEDSAKAMNVDSSTAKALAKKYGGRLLSGLSAIRFFEFAEEAVEATVGQIIKRTPLNNTKAGQALLNNGIGKTWITAEIYNLILWGMHAGEMSMTKPKMAQTMLIGNAVGLVGEEEVKAAYAEADTDIAEDFSESFNPGKTSLYEQIDLAWEEKFGKRQMPWAWGKLKEYTIDPALEQYNNFDWIANLTKGFKK